MAKKSISSATDVCFAVRIFSSKITIFLFFDKHILKHIVFVWISMDISMS